MRTTPLGVAEAASLGHVPHMRSLMKELMMICTDRNEKSTAIEGTACSTPVASAYPSATSMDLKAGLMKGMNIRGMAVRIRVEAGSVSWRRMLSRMTAESFLSIVLFFLSDDCEVGALQARLAYAHVLEAVAPQRG